MDTEYKMPKKKKKSQKYSQFKREKKSLKCINSILSTGEEDCPDIIMLVFYLLIYRTLWLYLEIPWPHITALHIP